MNIINNFENELSKLGYRKLQYTDRDNTIFKSWRLLITPNNYQEVLISYCIINNTITQQFKNTPNIISLSIYKYNDKIAYNTNKVNIDDCIQTLINNNYGDKIYIRNLKLNTLLK